MRRAFSYQAFRNGFYHGYNNSTYYPYHKTDHTGTSNYEYTEAIEIGKNIKKQEQMYDLLSKKMYLRIPDVETIFKVFLEGEELKAKEK